MAWRRDLPDLSAQLRGRERRRRRRSRRRCARLPYLRDLGVDAIWFTPWYLSPLADGGYDVADYRAIDPRSARSTRPRRWSPRRWRWASGRSSTSSPTTSPTSTRGSRRRSPPAPDRRAGTVLVPPGQGRRRRRCPTQWVSDFSGGTWTRTTNPDGTPGEWYLHLFTPQQPDLNWSHADVRGEFEDVLRFWFDRGVGRHPDRLRRPAGQGPRAARVRGHLGTGRAPARRPRRDPRRLPLAGASSPTPTPAPGSWSARCGWPTTPGSPSTCGRTRCTPRSTSTSWRGPGMPRRCGNRSTTTLAAHATGRRAGDLGAVQPRRHPAGDPIRPGRHVVRLCRQAVRHADRPRARPPAGAGGGAADRGAARLALRLPGRRARSARGGGSAGRTCCRTPCTSVRVASTRAGTAAGCRCPGTGPAAFRVQPAGGTDTWLPQPADWADLTVSAQLADPRRCSTCTESCRRAPGRAPSRRRPNSTWLDAPPDVLAFRRGDLACVLNLGAASVELPAHTALLLTSAPLDGGRLPADTAVWLRGERDH